MRSNASWKAFDSKPLRFCTLHIHRLYISSTMRRTAYLGGWAENPLHGRQRLWGTPLCPPRCEGGALGERRASAPHGACQRVQPRRGLLQVCCVTPLSAPAVHGRRQRVGRDALALGWPEAAQTSRRPRAARAEQRNHSQRPVITVCLRHPPEEGASV